MTSINIDTLDRTFNPSYIIAEAHYDSDKEDGDLPEASYKEGFNPTLVIIESCYKDSSSNKNVIVESRYSKKVMAETTIREDKVGIVDLSNSL